MSGKEIATASTTTTVNGYTLVVNIYGNREYAVFADPSRGNVEVARVKLPSAAKENSGLMANIFKRVVRLVVMNYDIQRKSALYEMEFLSGADLSNIEIKKTDLTDLSHSSKSADFLVQLGKIKN